jgi:hypothetical protein
MSRFRPARFAILLGCALHGAAGAAVVQHAEPLRGFRVEGEKPTASDAARVSFNAFSRDFALELEPNGRLAGLQQRIGTAAAYRGKVTGRPGSWVRLVLTAEGPNGLVFDGETLYGIETGGAARVAAGAPAMFRLADVYFAPGELGCERAAATAIDGEQAVAAMAEEFTALAAAAATHSLDLGAVADFEFSQAFGAGAEAALLMRFNNVDGIFSEQLGVQISVEEIDIFTASEDPFTTAAASALLDELANYRGATPSQDALDLTHLFTGRNLDGSTAGTAFFGAVCARRRPGETRSFGAGLSEASRGAVIDSLVAAHEIGHNFGAPHDGAGACTSTPTTFLMAPDINGSNQFSECSVREIQAEIEGAACLARIGPPDMSVTLAQPAQAFAGISVAQTATVDNEGADEATGVVFTATAEAGLAIEAAEAGGAICTVAPSSASCPLDAIAGGASRGVTLTLRAEAAGTFELAAAVTAAGDEDLSDNRAVVQVTAVPGVDLVWSAAPSAVALNTQATLTATLTNAADVAATSVAVSAALAAGLRPDQVTLGDSACTIAGQTVSCPARTLAARGSLPLTLMVTGTAPGTQPVTVYADTSEAERVPADNQLAIAMTVNAPQSSGGGGALSWLAVAALLAACAVRRAQASRERRRRRKIDGPGAGNDGRQDQRSRRAFESRRTIRAPCARS